MKRSKLALILGSTLVLSACGNLHDVDSNWCEPKKQELKTERVNLAADALFKFDKHSQKDLLVKGQESLDELAYKLKTGYIKVDRIELTGHTDRLGSEKYNYTLGLNRARTVKAYLESKGVTAPIIANSKGESEPITTGCVGKKSSAKLTECLQPDRRVVIDIIGILKANEKAK